MFIFTVCLGSFVRYSQGHVSHHTCFKSCVIAYIICGECTERWDAATKEALMNYQRGHYTVRGVPTDFVWRLLDYVTYVLPLLVQLVEIPGVLPRCVEGHVYFVRGV
jgi:hypothetical protein